MSVSVDAASFQHYILVPELPQASYIVVCHFLVAAVRTYLELSGVFVFHVLPIGYCACAHACVLSLFSRVWDMLWLAPIIFGKFINSQYDDFGEVRCTVTHCEFAF